MPEAIHSNDEKLRDLWKRYIDACVQGYEASSRHEEASFAAEDEIYALDMPWKFEAVIEPHTLAGPRKDLFRCREVRRVDCEDEVRVVAYPKAKSIKQATAASMRVLEPASAAYEKAVKAIRRKHRVAALNKECESAMSFADGKAHDAIADATAYGHVGKAIKMAFFLVGENIGPENTSEYSLKGGEQNALLSVYRSTVAEAGYDPAAEWYSTQGI